MDDCFNTLLADQDRTPDAVAGIGISVPGPVEHATGQVVSPPIMTGWAGFDIPAYFSRFDSPVMADNEVNAMAFGEHRTQYPDRDNLLMIKISTGGCRNRGRRSAPAWRPGRRR